MRRRILGVLLTAPITFPLMLTGCGSGPGKQTAAGAPPSADAQDKALKFAPCMRDNGVESYSDPEGSMMRITQEAAEDPDLKSGEEKCQKESAAASPGGS
ncbi:hypothetical protein [Nonomuraea sp. NPDC050783]|uniref:hypothetical protein n=1 Tax=Nonomuraea sp. NPDC050783 TaxID=3154634 RepID=UPI003467AC68